MTTSDAGGKPPARTIDERLAQIEIAVFGSLLQRSPGLIDSMARLAKQVGELNEKVDNLADTRRWWLQWATQIVTLLAAVAAVIAALK